MRAVVSPRPSLITDVDSLIDIELPEPVPTKRDLLVEVRAVSVNPVDVKVRRSERAEGPPRVLGWDAAGVVRGTGPDVSELSVGDHVYFAGDITRPGTNGECCLVDERIVGSMPRTLGFAEAAALPLTTITAYEGLFERMRVARGSASRGRNLLIVGGAGGVGSMAIQLAKALTGATVISTASRDESRAWALGMGSDHVLDHRSELRPQLAAIGIERVDDILCTADTDPYFRQLADLVAPQGVVCFIVPPRAALDLAPLHRKSASVAWEMMYTRSLFQTDDMGEQRRLLDEVARLVDDGRIRTTLTQRLSPISARSLREAHALIETGSTIGKIVLEGWS